MGGLATRLRFGGGIAARFVVCLLALAQAAAAGEAPEGLSTELVVSGLDQPVFLTAPAGDTRLFVLEQDGRIRIIANDQLVATPFLDIDTLVSFVSSVNSERGLLGLAFHPAYGPGGESCFFVNYTQTGNHDTAIARYSVSGDPDLADPKSGEVLLVVDQPFGNHNGGTIAFGPEAEPTLYIGMGDGGSQNDPGNRAQSDTSPLGKMLRYRASCTGPLTIPPDNPYTGDADPKDDVLDEIWARGFRNPYRFSFDRETGDLYIGDVGQDAVEEIDIEPAGSAGGLNYGWRIEEGSNCWIEDQAAVPCGDPSLIRPAHELLHGDGNCSVTGGIVYRGAIGLIRGHYFFTDFCSDRLWTFRWTEQGGVQDLTDRTVELAPELPNEIEFVSSFGEDGAGELYIVTHRTGQVYRVVPEPGAGASAITGLLCLALLAASRRRR